MRSVCKLFMAAILALGVTALPVRADEIIENWRLSGFEAPSFALYDEANSRIIVSNAGTSDEGYLSLVSLDGEMLEPQWVTGLTRPAGMVISDGTLFVAAGDRVVEIDPGKGVIVRSTPINNATTLAGVDSDGAGNIYVSDLMGQSIYRVSGGAAKLWLTDPQLTLPNGLTIDEGKMVIASTGANYDLETGQPRVPGGIIVVDMASKQVTAPDNAAGLGSLYGITKMVGIYWLTDSASGTIYVWDEGSFPADDAIVLAPGAAGLDAYDATLLVPMTGDGELLSLTFTE